VLGAFTLTRITDAAMTHCNPLNLVFQRTTPLLNHPTIMKKTQAPSFRL